MRAPLQCVYLLNGKLNGIEIKALNWNEKSILKSMPDNHSIKMHSMQYNNCKSKLW